MTEELAGTMFKFALPEVTDVALTPAKLANPVDVGVKLRVYEIEEVLVGIKVHVEVFAPSVVTFEQLVMALPLLKKVIFPATLDVALIVADAP